MPNANTYLPPTVCVPGSLLISNIQRTYPMIVTIINSDRNTYIVGQLVFLTVPATYGMYQANNLTGQIVLIDDDDFYLSIDARGFDVFTAPAGDVVKPASLSPAGARNLQFDNSTNNVPFHSLNNIGN